MSVVDELMSLEHRWNDTDWGKTEVLRENPVLVSSYLQTPHGMDWDRTWIAVKKV